MENREINLICQSQILLLHTRFYHSSEQNSQNINQQILRNHLTLTKNFNKEKENWIGVLPYLVLYSSKIVTFLLKAVREINNWPSVTKYIKEK